MSAAALRKPRQRRRFGLIGTFAVWSLVAVLGFAAAVGYAASFFIRQTVVDQATQETERTVQRVVGLSDFYELFRGVPSQSQLERLDEFFRRELVGEEVVAVKVWNADGTLLYGTDHEAVGKRYDNETARKAAAGRTVTELSSGDEEDLGSGAVKDARNDQQLLEVYAPITGGPVGSDGAVFEVYREWAPVEGRINGLLSAMWLIIVVGALALYLIQIRIVRSAAREIDQTNAEADVLASRLDRSLSDMELHSLGTLQALASTVDAKDSYTARHSLSVTDYAVAIAKRMDLSSEKIAEIEQASLLHDVGKIGVPEAVLLKPSRLDDEEFAQIRMHSEIGARIIESIPFLTALVPVVRHHHEAYNGTGYPDGLSGEEIPLEARILAVADAFDAMTSDRPYRKGLPVAVASEELVRCSGKQFDPACVDALVAALEAGDVTVARLHGDHTPIPTAQPSPEPAG